MNVEAFSDWELTDMSDQTEDVEELRDIVLELSHRLDMAKEQLGQVEVKPERNRDLARSVHDFAEWQTAGYKGDSSTRAIVTAQLWSEVSKNVRAVTGRCPENVDPDAAQLVLLAAEVRDGVPCAYPVQQSLFALT